MKPPSVIVFGTGVEVLPVVHLHSKAAPQQRRNKCGTTAVTPEGEDALNWFLNGGVGGSKTDFGTS